MPECSCPYCVSCCTNRPGWFKPGEAEKAAELFGMPLAQFFREYLVADFWAGGGPDGTDIKLLMPRTVGQQGGEIASWESAFATDRCVFLDDNNRCMIHAAKPFECAESMACDPKKSGLAINKEAGMAWNAPDHQRQVLSLLERK